MSLHLLLQSGLGMQIICDTHVLLFWVDAPKRLSSNAYSAVEHGLASGTLACADITLWEIAMLYAQGASHEHICF